MKQLSAVIIANRVQIHCFQNYIHAPIVTSSGREFSVPVRELACALLRELSVSESTRSSGI